MRSGQNVIFARFIKHYKVMCCFRIPAWAGLLAIVLFFSCTSRKNLVYFRDGAAQGGLQQTSYTPVFKKDDLLSIQVMALDPDAVIPFNIPLAQQYPSNIGGYSQGAPTPPGYLVDDNGDIDFPVLGKIRVAGLTRLQAVDQLKEKLVPYLRKPSVNMRILNYKVTVLGEVRNPGTFTIPNERITLPEALGVAGDLLITGVRKSVLVIRDVDGKKTETRVDLTSKEIFSSPVYYLQQNDIVYVEPNRARVNSSVVNTGNIGIVISVISLLITTLIVLNR